jgi:hypothetical protein
MLGLPAAITLPYDAACIVPGLCRPSTTKMWSSMFDELVTGVPAVLILGASDEDRDELLGAREDERDEELLWPNVFAAPERDNGGRSRSEGGEWERLVVDRKGEGRRLWLGAGNERVLALAWRWRPPAVSSSMKE